MKFLGYLIDFLIFVGDEAIEFWNEITLKRERDELKAIRKRMGWG